MGLFFTRQNNLAGLIQPHLRAALLAPPPAQRRAGGHYRPRDCRTDRDRMRARHSRCRASSAHSASSPCCSCSTCGPPTTMKMAPNASALFHLFEVLTSGRARCWSAKHQAAGEARYAARDNTSVKLFAGIGAMLSRRRPCSPARAARSVVSRTPHSGSCDRRLASKAALLGRYARRRAGTVRRSNSWPSGLSRRPAPANRFLLTRHGEMCSTLMQTIAARFAGSPASPASRLVIAEVELQRSAQARQGRMGAPGRDAGQVVGVEIVLGHHVMPGALRANSTTCWPVPLPTSRSSPARSARAGTITDQIGAWLR